MHPTLTRPRSSDKAIKKLATRGLLFLMTFAFIVINPYFFSNAQTSAKASLGTNLNTIANWSTEMPFIDAFKSSNTWIPHCISTDPGCRGVWDTGEFSKLNLDENGWVKSLPTPADTPEYTRVATVLFRSLEQYPGGQYVVLYDGEGTIQYKFDATKDTAASSPGRDIINVTPSNSGICLIITSTDPNKTGNYLRNIRVVPAQYEQTYQSQIFNPQFLSKINNFKALRFMDWMKTNNSLQSEWANRPKVQDASYFGKGVPVEVMVELANQLNIDPWFNMPHLATNEYITNFAQVVKTRLNPNLTAYIEFSNEVWNGSFKQNKYALLQGKTRWGQTKTNTQLQWYGMRTAQMCDIWENTFGSEKNRVACVISTQTAVKGPEKSVLDCSYWVAEGNTPCYQHGIDVYAITGYFGGKLGQTGNTTMIESWLKEADGGFSTAIKRFRNPNLPDSIPSLAKLFTYHANVATSKGLKLVGYEGGQHIVGSGGVENNEAITNFFIALNRRPEMYSLYTEVLNNWKQAGGTLFMHFSNIGTPTKYGSWGALEHVNQDTSPKYKALMDFIAQNP